MVEAGFAGEPPDIAAMREQALILAGRNGVENGRLRIQVSRGAAREQSGPDEIEGLEPTVLLTASPATGAPTELYEKGAVCVTLPQNRGRNAQIKSAGLLDSILARREVRAAGAWEGLLTTEAGNILEGVYTNIFFLKEKILITASEQERILPGVIRGKVIEAALEAGLSQEFATPAPADLSATADSAFLTSSLLGICPVCEIDGVRLEVKSATIAQLQKRLAEMEAASAATRQGP